MFDRPFEEHPAREINARDRFRTQLQLVPPHVVAHDAVPPPAFATANLGDEAPGARCE
jgi:hypothetical protein